MSRPVAAFDFDGTITTRDTLGPFLRAVAGTSELAKAAASCLREVGDRDAGRRRDRVKMAVVDRVFSGRAIAEVAPIAERHARRIAETFRPDVLDRIEWHRAEGHRLVLVSASLALYARPAVEPLGFDDVIAVELLADGHRYTGAMDGPNVRGGEKAVRLASLTGLPTVLWAYGNSAGDDDMLAMADHAVRVTRRGALDFRPVRKR